MKIFGLEISRAKPAVAKTYETPAEAWLAGEDVFLSNPLTNAYEQVVWVYRAVQVLAEQVANIPFLFSAGERGRESLITSGPLPEFYAHPHPLFNRFQYWELRVMWLMLRGECFRVPVYEAPDGTRAHSLAGLGRARGSRLRSVLLLDPNMFQHIVEDHQLVGWLYTGCPQGTPLASQVLLPEEVWHEKLPNPFDFWRGLAPLRVAATATRTDYGAASFMRGLIENNADAGLIVRSDTWLSDEQQTQIIQTLNNRKRCSGIPDRPIFLAGVKEIIKPQLTGADLQFLDNRKFTRAEICAAFGVPEEIVTTTDHAKYDVMEGARLNFIENRVAPLCSRLEAEEERTVRALDSRAVGWFDLESLPILQKSRRDRLAAARAAFEMGVPFNELNRVLDLGFKHLPWGDQGYLPSSFQPANSDRGPQRSADM
jgi:phage portal protein BeeE